MISLQALREQSLGTNFKALFAGRVQASPNGLVLYTCAFMEICSVLLGGGTRAGFLSDAVLQLLAIPALVVVLWSLTELRSGKQAATLRAWWPLSICLAIVFLPLIQVIPLPPSIWTRLPGHEGIEELFDLLNSALPWMPISVSPNATWLSFVSLLPPVAIFVGVIQLGYRERRRLSLLVVGLSVLSAFVGLIQVAQGAHSALRFFAFTNLTEAVGFFANRNHFAALLYVALLFSIPWGLDAASKVGSWNDIKSLSAASAVGLAAALVVPVIFITAEAMARSRAGIALTMIALAIGFAVPLANRRRNSDSAPIRPVSSKLLLGAIAIALMLIVQFAMYRILERYGSDPMEDARISFAHGTIQAALAFMPFGSGIGTFVPVYGMFEEPRYLLINTYANHAHDDFLELWLEAGGIGACILAGFVFWFGSRAVKIWRNSLSDVRPIDLWLARAATLAVILLAAHSFVDYPLRTGSIMAIFALACGLLVEPVGGTETKTRGAIRDQRDGLNLAPKAGSEVSHQAMASPSKQKSQVAVAAKPAPLVGGRWGEDITWPDEWSKPITKSSPTRSDDDVPDR